MRKHTQCLQAAAATGSSAEGDPGWFDIANREYVIRTPHLPGPWINYLGFNESLCGVISHRAGGSAWFRDCLKNRILRYQQVGSAQDTPGRYVYVRDNATGRSFSPTVWPVSRVAPDRYECRHGLGYTRITTGWNTLSFNTLHLIDPQPFTDSASPHDGVEVQAITLTNRGRRRRTLSVFAYREFVNGDVLDEVVRPAIRNYTVRVDIDRRAGAIYNLSGRSLVSADKPVFYFASVTPPVRFDTDGRAFLGDGQLHDPQAVRDGRCTNSVCRSNSAVGVFQVDVELAPGASRTLVFLLGAIDQPIADAADIAVSRASVRALRRRVALWRRNPAARLAKALRLLARNYDAMLSAFQCSLPGARTPGHTQALQNMANVWNGYGLWVNYRFSRSLSDHASGISRPMLGTRDSAQDLYGLAQLNAPAVRQRVLDWLALAQRADGSCFHHFSPVERRNDGVTGYSDDHLWIVKAVAIYLKETADFALLDERVGFADRPDRSATVFDHLLAAIRYSAANLGAHGIPLMLTADWNNVFASSYAQNVAEKALRANAESVLVGMMFVAMANDLAEMAEARARIDPAKRRVYAQPIAWLRQQALRQADALNRLAWFDAGPREGWYARGTDPRGRFFGVPDDREGRIFLLPQAWALMAGVAPADRIGRMLRAIRNRLYQPNVGLLLVDPPYRSVPPLGSFNVYPPGSRENGAVFCHAHAMAVVGIAHAGSSCPPEFVSELHAALLPPLASARMNWRDYAGPPYAYSQFRYGPRHPLSGQARGSWLTGTVGWSYYGLCQWLLGIRPDYDGLLVDPNIPPDWREYRVQRRFRNATYHITVRNPAGATGRVAGLVVDGRPVVGNRVPLFSGGTHQVDVRVQST